MSTLEDLNFDNQYATLGQQYFSPVMPTPFAGKGHVISINEDVFDLIGLDVEEAKRPEFIAYLTGEKPWQGAQPIAMRYAGHQFGQFVPQLGDGRAILLGQVRNGQSETWDLQLKGCGLTAYSRQGDGRAVLRSSIREYLCGEAMHGLGIPTTRSLCLLGSDEEVYRESLETAAMIVRVAPSHVRFGSFELFYHRQEYQHLKPLADHVIEEHFPQLAERATRYQDWLLEVTQLTASLMAQWQSVGFAHGVMNTDNMSVLGLTLDYGPYGFLDAYDPDFICNHSDHAGRYAFKQQPEIGLWNLSCFAQAIVPLLDDDPEKCVEIARDVLGRYQPMYEEAFAQRMGLKLGLLEADSSDAELVDKLLSAMVGNQVDYTIFFRSLADFDRSSDNKALRNQFINPQVFDAWAQQYAQRLDAEASVPAERKQRMNQINPRYILRNYLAQNAIAKAEQGDMSEINRLLHLLKDPFSEKPADDAYASLPPDWASRISVSCSS